MSIFDDAGLQREANQALYYTGRPASLTAMLRASARDNPQGEAIVDLGSGERVTYQSLWQRCQRVAGGLSAAGLQPGDRAAIQLANGLDWVLAFMGCQLAGVIAVPVNMGFADSEKQYVIDDSGATFVFSADQQLPDGEPLAITGQQPKDTAAIFYTSGTTGFPKGAITTHQNILSNCETTRRVADLPADGSLRNLVSVPLFHVTGCHAQLMPTLELCGTVVIMPAFEVQAFLGALEAERINTVVSVPAVYYLSINQPNFDDFDLSHITQVLYGGAPIAPALVAQIKQQFPHARVGNGFGLTETASIATFLPHEYADEHAESVGFPAPNMEVALHNPDADTGVGELLIRGSNVVNGYWNKPQATEKTFIDGWLHTGDLARINARGLVTIVDRAKDLVNRGGENVYCVEVENCLHAHPAVFEAAVLGVPDAMMGEKVGAVIVPKPGASIDPDEIVSFCRQHIGHFKVPQYIHVIDTPLPRNPGGKVVKPELRKSVAWGGPLF